MSNQALQRDLKATGYAYLDGAPVTRAEKERDRLSVRCLPVLIGINPNSITNYAGRRGVVQHIALVTVLDAEMSSNGIGCRATIAEVAPTRQPRGITRRGSFGGGSLANLDLRS